MRRVGLLVGLALLVLACGVPEDDSPQELSADQVPFGLLTTPTTTTEPSQVPPPERRATLYVVNADGKLVEHIGEVENQSADAVIQALLAIDPAGLDPGLSSAIPPGTERLDIFAEDDVLTVDFNEQFSSIEGTRFIQAVAQVVFTATDIPGGTIDAVAFRVEGRSFGVPDEEGAVQTAPVSPNDYQSLLAVNA